eukprot:4156162-Alexandrium_andersonii.AAC.1
MFLSGASVCPWRGGWPRAKTLPPERPRACQLSARPFCGALLPSAPGVGSLCPAIFKEGVGRGPGGVRLTARGRPGGCGG